MKRLLCLLLPVLLWCLPVPARADVDPPGRVARVGWSEGSVFLRNAYYVDWQRLAQNWPVTTGDVLWTGAGARLELRIGSSVLRLDSGTELEVLRLDDNYVDVMLHSGSAAMHLRSDEQARGFTMRTREGGAAPLLAGRYRFDRNGETTTVSVASGRLTFAGVDAVVDVDTGRRTEFWNSGSLNYRSHADLRGDHFADWIAGREHLDEQRLRARHVSPEMTGYEELYDHGQWGRHEEFGAIWYPVAVPAGWAPYRSGRWVWVAPWGWNWVDDAPWGFAPFHYGRWVNHRGRWAWVPGRYVARPVYAPALVVWIGDAGFPAVQPHQFVPVGWFPLGPREVFVPGYRVTPIYERKLNAGHFDSRREHRHERLTPPSRYLNRGVADAVTVVPANVVRDARAVAPSRLASLPRHDAMTVAAAPVAPARQPAVSSASRADTRAAVPRGNVAPASGQPPVSATSARASAVERRPPPGAGTAAPLRPGLAAVATPAGAMPARPERAGTTNTVMPTEQRPALTTDPRVPVRSPVPAGAALPPTSAVTVEDGRHSISATTANAATPGARRPVLTADPRVPVRPPAPAGTGLPTPGKLPAEEGRHVTAAKSANSAMPVERPPASVVPTPVRAAEPHGAAPAATTFPVTTAPPAPVVTPSSERRSPASPVSSLQRQGSAAAVAAPALSAGQPPSPAPHPTAPVSAPAGRHASAFAGGSANAAADKTDDSNPQASPRGTHEHRRGTPAMTQSDQAAHRRTERTAESRFERQNGRDEATRASANPALPAAAAPATGAGQPGNPVPGTGREARR